MTESFATIRQHTLDALEQGDARQAFGHLRWALEYPRDLDDQQWSDALALFIRVGSAIAGDKFGGKIRRVAENRSDLQALYDLGYELIEQDLPGIAATFLTQANQLAPEQEAIVTELVTALERAFRCREACQILRAAPGLLASSFLCQYLLAFQSIMSGDLEEPRRLLPVLQRSRNPDQLFMAARIEEMLQRADALNGVSPFDIQDLRGWHFVLNGSLLLHRSPYGLEEMRGRYAFTQDSPSRCLEGIRRMAAVLEHWRCRPTRVYLLPDRDSTALGLATSRILDVPVELWSLDGSREAGLIIAYDLSTLDPEVATSLYEHRSGQVLWSHASCWTTEPPFAADLVTYLYQYNTSPWGAGLRVNPETGTTEQMGPTEAPVEELAQSVASATLEDEDLADMPSLLTLAEALQKVTGAAAAGAFRNSGNRRKQWLGSPVPSNRFL